MPGFFKELYMPGSSGSEPNGMRPPVITLCVLTYRRPVGVARTLEGLGRLAFSRTRPALRIVVVDNDPAGSARQAVADAAASLPWPVTHYIEPQRGITYARNRGLAEAGDTDWFGFIDDDEVPAPDWLDQLLRVQREYNADVVAGPVIAELPAGAPRWIKQGGFFNQPRYATGTLLPFCYTNNVLFRSRILKDSSLRFDHRFALTGGEDRAFFQRIGRDGYRIVWADEACVRETVPESRACARWLLQRSYRNGNAGAVADLVNTNGLKTRIRLFAHACWHVVRGVFFLPLTWPLGRKYPVLYLQYVLWGAGMIAGMLGIRYAEYKKTHGH